jgi:heme exporter protein A
VQERSADGTTPALRARGVFRRYGFQWALRGVDLTVARGSITALIGANGSGKTTLLKIIATGLKPTRGAVEVMGFDVTESPDEVRRRVGLLSHYSYLYEELTALENLRFAAAMYGISAAEAAADAALRSVGLLRVRDAYVRTFSSGMKKRLSLARANLHAPELVLLDEPYGALDAAGLEWVDRLLHTITERGATVIVATHHVERVLPLAQRVVWLAQGRIRYDGAPSGLPSGAAGSSEAWEEA